LYKLYTVEPDFESFSFTMAIGGCTGGVTPGIRESYDDGQLKIMTDVILALDDVACKKVDKRYQILVIGSSHPGFPASGKSYEVISKILPNSDVYLYDPANVNYELEIGITKYYYISGKYGYKDIKKYDIVLDDAWVEGTLHVDRDPEFLALSVANYSVKKFPYEDFPSGNVYYQLFGTKGYEQRSVSRVITYNYKPISGLGKCAACDELRYLMRGSYDGLAEMFMGMHKKNCETGQLRVDIKADFFSSDLWRPYNVRPLKEFKKFPWDNFDLPDVTMNHVNLLTSKIVVSSWLQLPAQLLDSIDYVIIQHEGLYYSKDEVKSLKYGFIPYDSCPVLELDEVDIENYNWIARTDRTRMMRDNIRTGVEDTLYFEKMVKLSNQHNRRQVMRDNKKNGLLKDKMKKNASSLHLNKEKKIEGVIERRSIVRSVEKKNVTAISKHKNNLKKDVRIWVLKADV